MNVSGMKLNDVCHSDSLTGKRTNAYCDAFPADCHINCLKLPCIRRMLFPQVSY